jgi:death on curing protein
VSAPIWVDAAVALAIHDEQLAEHGGAAGARDLGAFESAMARPVNLAAYGEHDLAALAASYGFGLARNHAFVDGNKRTAFVVSILFLMLNGVRLTASDAAAILTFVALAAGELSEDGLAQWFRDNTATA